jgi:hypothetical protein
MVTRPDTGAGTGPSYVSSMETPELPDLPPGAEALLSDVERLAVEGRACESVTETVIKDLIARIGEARGRAEANVVANGPGTGGGAADAATVSAHNVGRGEEILTDLVKFLRDANVLGPSGAVVNPVGGYAVYNRVRETILALHYARHFAAVSAAWNSERDPSGALDCIALLTALLPDLETLSATATRCYLSLWYRDM